MHLLPENYMNDCTKILLYRYVNNVSIQHLQPIVMFVTVW